MKLENETNFKCCRIEEISERNSFEKIPTILEKLFVDNSLNLNETRKNIFADFLCECEDVFSKDIVAGNCDVVEHVINVKDSSLIKQVPRCIPIHLREKVLKSIEGMKERGVIEELQSSWIFPAVLKEKKDKTLRFCVDYRKLNTCTVKNYFPLPRIHNILDQLSGNNWFSTIDLKSDYWQIKICVRDKKKNTFSIGNELWQFTVTSV